MKVTATAANQQTQSRAVANNVSLQKNNRRSDSESAQFVDNRPETKTLQSLQMIINRSSRMAAQRQRMANITGGTAQTDNVIMGPNKNIALNEGNSANQVPIQEKVAVAKTDKEEENDWVILTNLQFAKELVGGDVVDFGSGSDFSNMSDGENLAIVGHGEAGEIQGFDAEKIAAALTKEGKEMPKKTKSTRKVILLSCNAAAPTEQQDPKSSLVSKLAFLLHEAGYGAIVEGKPSFTQVSPATGINATKPSEETKHLQIEEAMINKHDLNFTTSNPPQNLSPERIEWLINNGADKTQMGDSKYVQFLKDWLVDNDIRKFASEILTEQGINHSSWTVEQKAAKIAEITGPFYEELMKETTKEKTLFEPGTSSGSGTLLAHGSEVLEL